jgi:hypothetical protein
MTRAGAVDTLAARRDNSRVQRLLIRFGAVLLGLAVFTVLLTQPFPAHAQGCSMCNSATGGANDPLGRALHWSTLFMVSMPFLVVGSISGYLTWSHLRPRRRRRRGAAGPEDPSAGEHA